MLEVVLPPLVTAYAIFVAMVVVLVRRPAPRSPGRGGRPVDGVERRPPAGVVGTTVGGYVAFLVIVLVFHVAIAGEDVFASAVWGGGFLSIVALGVAACGPLFRRRFTRRG